MLNTVPGRIRRSPYCWTTQHYLETYNSPIQISGLRQVHMQSQELPKLQQRRPDPGEIETLLLRHPNVKEAAVIAREDMPRDEHLEVYVAVNLNNLKIPDSGVPSLTDASMVHRWNTLYDLAYSKGPEGPSFSGWTSSYTRKPIPDAQMLEWLTMTLERIGALKPQRLLEIGCGVGLLVQHLAPQCPTYVATDISAAGLSRLRKWMQDRADLSHVELLHRSALDLQELKPNYFDTIVLNSVVQYFPNVDYLLAVLNSVHRLLLPGGRVFIGDVRNFKLLSTFHSSVQFQRATDETSAGQLKRRVSRAIAQETELTIDPTFFYALPALAPWITAVDVQLKRGDAQNELTRYRYDAVLHAHEEHPDPGTDKAIAWHTSAGFSPEIQTALHAKRWPALRLTGIPNSRLSTDEAARNLIYTSDERTATISLRRQLEGLQVSAVDPVSLWKLGESQGYNVCINWDSQKSADHFEACFLDRALSAQTPFSATLPPDEVRPWNEYTNNPLENRIAQQIIPSLREYLQHKLPDNMIPPVWTILKQLPRGPNGEVDRRAL